MSANVGVEASHPYKRTEIGVIPSEWNVRSVEELVGEGVLERPLDGNHGSIHPKSAEYVSHGIPFVMANHVQDGTVDLLGCKFITRERAEGLQKGFSITGDVLLTHKGTVGNTAIVPPICTDYIMLTPQVTYYRVADKQRLSNQFLKQYFDSQPFQSLFKGLAGGGTRAYLGIVKQLALPILEAPIEEQRAIGAALSDVDALLAGLDRLIAKKRDFKQAALQQLLTGQTRLPGFGTLWAMKRLDAVADIDPEGLGSSTRRDFTFNYIALEDVDQGVLRSHSEQTFGCAPSRARRKLRTGDVLVSTVRPNLRSHLLFDAEHGDWVCSTGFCVVRCYERVAHPAFVFAHLFGSSIAQQIDVLLTGSNYPAINSRDVRALEIAMPGYIEQAAIAAVLAEMNAEVTALEARRDKTRALKQAMMQELLTGRIRLV